MEVKVVKNLSFNPSEYAVGKNPITFFSLKKYNFSNASELPCTFQDQGLERIGDAMSFFIFYS